MALSLSRCLPGKAVSAVLAGADVQAGLDLVRGPSDSGAASHTSQVMAAECFSGLGVHDDATTDPMIRLGGVQPLAVLRGFGQRLQRALGLSLERLDLIGTACLLGR